jgi:hypothetical protein
MADKEKHPEPICRFEHQGHAIRFKEILAQRLRQTWEIDSIDNARKCLAIGFESIKNTRTGGWFTIILAENRPVEKLDLDLSAMREFLRGVQKGEQLAKKAAKDAALLALGSKGKLNKLLAGKKKRSRKA